MVRERLQHRVWPSSMNPLTVSIAIVSLSFHVKAQNLSKSLRPRDGAPAVQHKLHPNAEVVIGIITMMATLTFLTLAYTKFCNTHGLQIPHQDSHGGGGGGVRASDSRISGIDPATIESLPFFRFSSLRGSKEGLECAVCISRFEEPELLRLLPKCKHAFHKDCIDKWLEKHSSCPLCRYRIDPKDLDSFAHSKNLNNYLRTPSNLSEDPHIDLFIQREQEHPGTGSSSSSSSRFISLGSSNSQKKKEKGKQEEEMRIEEGNSTTAAATRVDQKVLHKFNHKIIVSDVINNHRWSDLNSSDLLSLNSEMLIVMSSSRFSTSSSGRGGGEGLSRNESIEKIKEEVREKKRVEESKISTTDNRSMSEITNYSRFRELRMNQSSSSSSSSNRGLRENGREERTRRLWMSIARRTVHWFAGRESNLPPEPPRPREASNV